MTNAIDNTMWELKYFYGDFADRKAAQVKEGDEDKFMSRGFFATREEAAEEIMKVYDAHVEQLDDEDLGDLSADISMSTIHTRYMIRPVIDIMRD